MSDTVCPQSMRKVLAIRKSLLESQIWFVLGYYIGENKKKVQSILPHKDVKKVFRLGHFKQSIKTCSKSLLKSYKILENIGENGLLQLFKLGSSF